MPSPLPDHVLVEHAISALCLVLTAAGPMFARVLPHATISAMCERCVHTFVTIRANRWDSKLSAVSLAWAHEPLKRLSEKSSVSARYNSTRFVDSTLRGVGALKGVPKSSLYSSEFGAKRLNVQIFSVS